ncbi:MAG: hypothetical protein ACXVBW_02995 [Bdellovibrionota bacterium]
MSPWTAFLESLHSALIDELIEIHPEPKPELGMPSRSRELRAPAEGLAYFAADVTLAETRGVALIGMDPGAERALGLAPGALWTVVFKRAGTEFHRRAIMPRLEGEKSVAALGGVGAALQKVVWIPFKLGEARVFLGMGVT